MRLFPTTRAALAAIVALPLALLAGCDTAGSNGASSGTDAVSNQEAAVAVANGLSLDGGGALDAVGAAAMQGGGFDSQGGNSPEPGCTFERSFDEATVTWTRIVACDRTSPNGEFFARFGRTQTLRFLDAAGVPQQSPETAAALDLVLVDGYGERQLPHLHHVLLDIGGSLHVDDLHEELVTVNGTYHRSATDTLRVRRPGEPVAVRRTLIYDLALTITDVVGPRRDHGHWGRPVSGMIEGTVEGTATHTAPDGTVRTREFSREFTIIFGEDPAADTALMRVGGQAFRVDLRTGDVVGVR